MNKNIKATKRIRRHKAIRARVSGTADKPRLAVFKSNRFMYAQLIDDVKAVTVAAASSVEAKGKKVDAAKAVGTDIAKKAKALKIETVVFDRGGFAYKGRVKALADAAREGGLKF
ncbi:MAG TPA: 50S ribosomal protein L18 [Candidatus Paceibacterota bacterium]|jgi:ribosomal protein L18, bacterial type